MDRERAERERRLGGFGKDHASRWAPAEATEWRPGIGKLTLAGMLAPASGPVQRKLELAASPDPAQIHASAQRGIATASSALPHGDRIQRLFGRHDISAIRAHTGAAAAASARAMGAAAYATGDHVVLGDGADLHTVAHEVAHVVQQRAGVQLLGGVGAVGDVYERHADAVADLVVRGESAEILLDAHAPGGASTAGPIQRMVLTMLGGGRYRNLDVQPGEKPEYDMAIAEDKRAVEAYWAREQQIREEEERRRDEEAGHDDGEGQAQAQDQLLVAGPQDAHAQVAVDQHGQSHVPDVEINFSGNEYLDPRGDSIVASSKTIDLHASWTPGPTPPEGHTPQAIVGWVQNVVFHNKQADYFDAQDNYVESSFKEHNRPVIDSDDPASPFYDPPRPYQEVRSAQELRLFGAQPTGARGIPLNDKPQDVFPMTSPRGGLLYRFGCETRFVACLVMMEPDGSKTTVLEWVAWKYEYGYTLRTVPVGARSPSYARPTEFTTLYADTYVTGRAAGEPSGAYTTKVGGPHGNVFFEQLRPSWEPLNAARDPYDTSRFPSFI